MCDLLFDQGCQEIPSLPYDDVLLSFQDEQVPAVEESEITSPEHAVREGYGTGCRRIEVPGGYTRSPECDLPQRVFLAKMPALLVDEADLHTGHGRADRENGDTLLSGPRHRIYTAFAQDAHGLTDGSTSGIDQ